MGHSTRANIFACNFAKCSPILHILSRATWMINLQWSKTLKQMLGCAIFWFVISHKIHIWYYRQFSDIHISQRTVVGAWHSGRTSVSDWRIFPVLRSTCSWWLTTNVGKPTGAIPAMKPEATAMFAPQDGRWKITVSFDGCRFCVPKFRH